MNPDVGLTCVLKVCKVLGGRLVWALSGTPHARGGQGGLAGEVAWDLKEQWSRQGKDKKGRRPRERTFQYRGVKVRKRDPPNTTMCGAREDNGPS